MRVKSTEAALTHTDAARVVDLPISHPHLPPIWLQIQEDVGNNLGNGEQGDADAKADPWAIAFSYRLFTPCT